MIVQLQEATQYYYYRAVLALFPLTPDQIKAQIWPNGVRAYKHQRNTHNLSVAATIFHRHAVR